MSFEMGTPQVTCAHCDAGLVVGQGARLVRLGCPRCGGNFYYIDGSLCGRCPYCEASLLALTEDRVLRYVVRPAAEAPAEAAGAELRLLPFWHLGGLLYAWLVGAQIKIEEDPAAMQAQGGGADAEPVPTTTRRDSGPQKVWAGRVVDMSLPDPATLALGVTSLRLRAGVFPLEPFAQQHESLGVVVPATLDQREAREQLLGRAVFYSTDQGLTRVDCRRIDLVADSLSLYYYPFWVLRRGDGGHAVWDAVSGEPEALSSPADPPTSSATTIFDDLQLVELSCPACGAELPAGNHSSVLPCRGCGRFWRVSRQGLQPFEARFARPRQGGSGQPAWLPFWQVPVQLGYAGKQASKAGDLITALGVLRPPGEAPPPDAPLCYYTPAFGAMHAPRVDHAARDLTRSQPVLEAGEPGAGELYNCFYGEDDALRLGYATWILVVPGTVPHRLRSLRVQAGAPRLWYIPFDQDAGGRELVNLVTGVRYDRAAFRGVRH